MHEVQIPHATFISHQQYHVKVLYKSGTDIRQVKSDRASGYYDNPCLLTNIVLRATTDTLFKFAAINDGYFSTGGSLK